MNDHLQIQRLRFAIDIRHPRENLEHVEALAGSEKVTKLRINIQSDRSDPDFEGHSACFRGCASVHPVLSQVKPTFFIFKAWNGVNIETRYFNRLTQRVPIENYHRNRNLQKAKNLLNKFPKLNSLNLNQEDRWDVNYGRIQFDAFPSVSTLTFNDWSFNVWGVNGDTTVQNLLDCSILKHLALNGGYVLPVLFSN